MAGVTPLHMAAFLGLTELAEQLLQHGAIVDATVHNGCTALFIAASRGHEPMVKLLLRHGANVGATNGDGMTSLHRAADRGCEAVVKVLLEQGANVGAEDNNGLTPLHYAVFASHWEVVKLMWHGCSVRQGHPYTVPSYRRLAARLNGAAAGRLVHKFHNNWLQDAAMHHGDAGQAKARRPPSLVWCGHVGVLGGDGCCAIIVWPVS